MTKYTEKTDYIVEVMPGQYLTVVDYGYGEYPDSYGLRTDPNQALGFSSKTKAMSGYRQYYASSTSVPFGIRTRNWKTKIDIS